MKGRLTPSLDATIRNLVMIVQTIIGQAVTNHLSAERRRPEAKADRPEHLDRPIPRESLLSLREVCRLAGGLSQTSIYALIAEDMFPNSVQLGERRVAWRAGEVFDWCANRPTSPTKRAPAHQRKVS